MIVMLLAEHEYSKPVHISKFGESLTIEPSEIVPPDAAPILHRVLRVLDETLGNENPTLYAAVGKFIHHMKFFSFNFNSVHLVTDFMQGSRPKVSRQQFRLERI